MLADLVGLELALELDLGLVLVDLVELEVEVELDSILCEGWYFQSTCQTDVIWG